MLIISTIGSSVRVYSKSWFLAKTWYSDLTPQRMCFMIWKNIFVFSHLSSFNTEGGENQPTVLTWVFYPKGQILALSVTRFTSTLLVVAFFLIYFIGILTLKVFRLEAIKVGWLLFRQQYGLQASTWGQSLLGTHGGPLWAGPPHSRVEFLVT